MSTELSPITIVTNNFDFSQLVLVASRNQFYVVELFQRFCFQLSPFLNASYFNFWWGSKNIISKTKAFTQ